MAMFQSCNNVTFNGGTYNQIVYSRDEEEAFRKIRLGDIHLVKCLDERELVEYRPKKSRRIKATQVVVGVRRMYHANIFGSNATFTVMAYEGRGGAACLQQDLDVQACLPRHPNLWQLFGVTMTRNLYALTYHDDLIPWVLANSACHSDLTQTVFWYLTMIQIQQLEKTIGIHHSLENYTIGNSGVLSMEVGADLDDPPLSGSLTAQSNQDIWRPLPGTTLFDCMQQDDSQLMNLLSVDDVVEVLCHQFSEPQLYTLARPQIPRIHLGAVYHHARRGSTYTTMEATAKIFSFPVAISETVDHWASTKFLQPTSDSPYFRAKAVPKRHTMRIYLQPHIETELNRRWLTQANSLVPFMEDLESSAGKESFLATELHISYKMVFPDWDITLQGTFMADEVPTNELYLFLKRPHKFLEDGVLAIELPFDPLTGHLAYFWSVHPDGREPLDQADLDKYCPPHIETEIEVWGPLWTKEDYKIIADVMRAKGYDPTTTDYARQHGIPEPIFHTVTEPVGALGLLSKHGINSHMQN